MKKAIYIGAGLDIRPIKALSNDIDHFIYVDSRPFTQQPSTSLKQYDANFVSNFINKMEAMDFVCNFEANTSCCFNNKNKPFCIRFESHDGKILVDYFMNHYFPNKLTDECKKNIKNSAHLIIAGYHPKSCILNMLLEPISIYTWYGTWYGLHDDDEEDEETIVQWLYKNPKNKRIKKIIYYEKQYIPHEHIDIESIEKFRNEGNIRKQNH